MRMGLGDGGPCVSAVPCYQLEAYEAYEVLRS